MSYLLAPSVDGVRPSHAYMPLGALVAGGAAGGFLLGSLLGVVAALLSEANNDAVRLGFLWAFSGLAVGALIRPQFTRWMPERACQVAADGLRRNGIGRGSFAWGFELGTGVQTFVVTPLVYAAIAVVLASGSFLLAMAAGSLYGLVRVASIAGVAIYLGRSSSERPPFVGMAHRWPGGAVAATVLAALILTVG